MALVVNGEYVDDAVIREESERIRERLREEMPDESGPELDMKVREWAVDNLVERVLLRQAASGFAEAQAAPVDRDRGATADSDSQVAAFIHHLTASIPRPTRREVSDYYRKNQILFLTPECVHVSQILKHVDERVNETEALAAMETAEAALRSGRPFAEVADEFSDFPDDGGDLGWLVRGQIADEFDAAVFGLKPTQVSPIFRSPLGFHLAKLHGRKKAGVLPLRYVYNVAEELMMKRRRDEKIECFLEDVRAKSEISRASSNKADATS